MSAVTKEQFDAYEQVRESGATNMFDVRNVSALSGLDRDTIMTIMMNYAELAGKYKQDAGR